MLLESFGNLVEGSRDDFGIGIALPQSGINFLYRLIRMGAVVVAGEVDRYYGLAVGQNILDERNKELFLQSGKA